MNLLVYTKPTVPVQFSAIRRCCSGSRKTWYSENHRHTNLVRVYTCKNDTRFYLRSIKSSSWSINSNYCRYLQTRCFRASSNRTSQEPSSKVEETVKSIKEEKEKKEKKDAAVEVVPDAEKAVAEKRTLWQKIKAEMLHYYHGFRLLGLDVKVSAKLIWRILQGKELSRREHRLLVKTTGDLFRLIPFSVFIIVPFMEFLLPVFIKFFPNMLPSTFQTVRDKEDKLKQALKVKIEVAKFLQQTLDDMAVQSSDHRSKKAKEFSEFFYKIRTTGALASTEEILQFSKLFEDEITLDSLSRPQLIALCRVVDVQPIGTTNFLRFLLRMKLRSLAADDRLIEKEGVESLTRAELQQACRARGMRAYGMPEHRLREQLSQWLDLSLHQKVPPSLLLLSRALMVPETIPMSDKLKATISALPDSVVARTKGAIGEKEGKMDHKTNIEIIKLEEQKIEEERKEQMEIEAKQQKKEKIQKMPAVEPTVLVAHNNNNKEEVEVTSKDVKVLEQALDSIGKEKKKMSLEKEELKELKEEMAEYQEDIKELLQMKAQSKGQKDIESIKVSKGANRLFTEVNKMINKMDAVLTQLEHSEQKMKEKIEALPPEEKTDSKVAAELVRIDELIAAIKQIQNVSDEDRLNRIAEILAKIDDDRDGAIKIEHVLKVIELIGKEEVNLSKKQVNELLDLMNKEEVLEVEDQIQKALQKESKASEREEEENECMQDTSKSTVPATPVTKPDKKLDGEDLNENSDFPSSSSLRESATILKSGTESKTPVAPSVPPSPKKTEGTKRL